MSAPRRQRASSSEHCCSLRRLALLLTATSLACSSTGAGAASVSLGEFQLGQATMKTETYMVPGWAVRAFSQWGGTVPYSAPASCLISFKLGQSARNTPASPRSVRVHCNCSPDNTLIPASMQGPCLSVNRHNSIPLEMSRAAQTSLTVTAPNGCQAIPGPYPVVLIFNGYQVRAQYYKSIVDRLASWGYAVIQYDRPGRTTPSSETETAFVDKMLAWAAQANATGGHPLYGALDTSRLGVIGHSMGGSLATIVAQEHSDQALGLVLLDPVDYTQLSTRVAREYIQRYPRPALIMTVGVHCVDRTGCVPPLDHRPTPEDEAKYGKCRPSWFCCDWDDNKPGMETKSLAELTEPTDGPTGYIEFAAPGTVVAKLKDAGHMSFMDWNPLTDPGFRINCPYTKTPSAILPDVLPLVAAWMDRMVRGVDISWLAEWAAVPAVKQRVEVSFKGQWLADA